MTKEQISTYTMRITQANTSALAVVLYDMILDCVNESLESYAENQEEKFESALQQAKNFLHELMSMSNINSPVSYDVMSLYLFIDKQFLMSIVKRKPVNLTECRQYLEQLRSSFVEISKTDYDAPIMENTQQVYAGLTYGKGFLNESCDPMEGRNRGLQV